MMGRNIVLVLSVFCSTALAQSVSVTKATDLYAEYKSNPLAADAKYEGHRITISGTVIKTDFVDAGVGHIRSILLAGDKSNITTDAVSACFTESCSSFRRPTVSDEAFKKVKVGAVISAICTVEPVIFDGTRKSKLVMVQASKCASLGLSVAATVSPTFEGKFEWAKPAILRGSLRSGTFSNCCTGGKEVRQQYYYLQLEASITVDSDNDVEPTLSNVKVVQLGAAKGVSLKMLKEGQTITVSCKELWFGSTGHYALPTYCMDAQLAN